MERWQKRLASTVEGAKARARPDDWAEVISATKEFSLELSSLGLITHLEQEGAEIRLAIASSKGLEMQLAISNVEEITLHIFSKGFVISRWPVFRSQEFNREHFLGLLTDLFICALGQNTA